MRWYSVSVLSNFEKKVAESIRHQAAQEGLEDQIEQVLVPTEEVVEMRRNKKVQTERRFMPGYVLIRMEMTDKAYHLVNNTNRVTGFLGPQGKPTPLLGGQGAKIKPISGLRPRGRRPASAPEQPLPEVLFRRHVVVVIVVIGRRPLDAPHLAVRQRHAVDRAGLVLDHQRLAVIGQRGMTAGRRLVLGPSAALRIGGITAVVISDRTLCI